MEMSKYDIVELDSVVFFNVSSGGVDVNYLFFKTIIITCTCIYIYMLGAKYGLAQS